MQINSSCQLNGELPVYERRLREFASIYATATDVYATLITQALMQH